MDGITDCCFIQPGRGAAETDWCCILYRMQLKNSAGMYKLVLVFIMVVNCSLSAYNKETCCFFMNSSNTSSGFLCQINMSKSDSQRVTQ